jgi:hypothetical protein
MTTNELSDLFFNFAFTQGVLGNNGELVEDHLQNAAETFLATLPSLEQEITKEWLINDFRARL